LRRQAPREVDPALWTGKRRIQRNRFGIEQSQCQSRDPADGRPRSGPRKGAVLLRAAAARTGPADGKTAVVEATAVLHGVTRRVTSSRPWPRPWPLL
jgi:hypothetical protein